MDGLPPLLSAGHELPAYWQSGVVPATVSGTNGEQYFIFPLDYMYTIFFLMFRCHYVCYVLHVADSLPPLLSPGQELAAYGQSGVVPATVSRTPSRDTG